MLLFSSSRWCCLFRRYGMERWLAVTGLLMMRRDRRTVQSGTGNCTARVLGWSASCITYKSEVWLSVWKCYGATYSTLSRSVHTGILVKTRPQHFTFKSSSSSRRRGRPLFLKFLLNLAFYFIVQILDTNIIYIFTYT